MGPEVSQTLELYQSGAGEGQPQQEPAHPSSSGLQARVGRPTLALPTIPGRAGYSGRESAQHRMKCSGSETFVTSTSAILSDHVGGLFIDAGGARVSRLSCALSHHLSVTPPHPPSLPQSPPPLFLFSFSLLSSLHFSSPFPSLPCHSIPFPLSLPPLLPYLPALFPPPGLSPLDRPFTPFTPGRRPERLPGGRTAHPLRHFPLLDLYIKRPF